MEKISEGAHALQHVALRGLRDARRLIEHHSCEIISLLYWRTGPAWSIPTRSLDDCMLFIPTRGEITLTVDGRSMALKPGHVGFMPQGVLHSAAYRRGTRHLQVFALHFHCTDRYGGQALSLFKDHVHGLAMPERWHARIWELTAIVNQDPLAGRAIGRILVMDLLSEVMLNGADMRTTEPEIDPRIREILAHAHRPDADLAVGGFARKAGLSEVHFRTLFKEATTMAPKAYLAQMQMNKAKELLQRTPDPIKMIALACGFCSDHYFHRRFKQTVGMSPSEFRRHHALPAL